jgi:hypothetical protein
MARFMPGVVKRQFGAPVAGMAMTPPVPPSARTSSSTAATASAGAWAASRTRASISCATPARRKNSPAPVQDTAQLRSSAQVPAPITGESPIRPQRLPVTPPVEVAEARWPAVSRATAPTVPYFMSTS